jgi:predicted nucleic acid-binding protein
MVLVDTSVWIRSLAGHQPFLHQLKRLLLADEVAGHDLVYGELLIGDLGGRMKALRDYETLFQAATVPHSEVVAFAKSRRLHGLGVGWIDVHLLASAIVSGLKLWTLDSRLLAIAKRFGVEYRPLP